MNDDLAWCLVEIYVNARELLGSGLRIIEALPEDDPTGDELLSACTEAMLFARSFSRDELHRIPWKMEQVGERFRTAGTLLRRLRTEGHADQSHVTASIEIAERGGDMVLTGGRLFPAGPRWTD